MIHEGNEVPDQVSQFIIDSREATERMVQFGHVCPEDAEGFQRRHTAINMALTGDRTGDPDLRAAGIKLLAGELIAGTAASVPEVGPAASVAKHPWDDLPERIRYLQTHNRFQRDQF